jgi:hypothetical protein
MMAPGFKPVGWVAAVAASAIGCYMLSLNVASERADLLRVERQIIATKQDIRSLQTELGTRGRLAQLEQWNADVLALSAPTTGQFLDNEVKLARFDQRAPTVDERAEVRMAAAEVAPAPATRIEAPVDQASAPAPLRGASNPLVREASLTVPAPKIQKAAALVIAPVRPAKIQASLPVGVRPAKARSADSASTKSEKAAATLPSPAKPVRTASADPVLPKPVRAASTKSAGGIDAKLAQQIAVAAKLEAARGTR